jgi:NitT/TauT family transport system substrate-binding protein
MSPIVSHAIGLSRKSLLAGLAAAGLGTLPRRATAQDLPIVRVGELPIDIAAQAYYAQDLGWFKKAGLEVTITTMQSAPVLAAAVAGGALDIGASSFTTLAIARERGVKFACIAPAGAYSSDRGGSSLVVSKSSQMRTAKDLNGKTVALDAVKNITSVALHAWMDKNGGDFATVRLFELPVPQMGVAIKAGRVDAAFISEPALSEAIASGDLEAIAKPFDAIAKSWILGAWFTTADYAASHGDIVRKFAGVMQDTARWANANQNASGKILEKYTKIAVTSTTNRVHYPETFRATEMQPLIDASAKYGLLQAPFPAVDMLAPGIPYS